MIIIRCTIGYHSAAPLPFLIVKNKLACNISNTVNVYIRRVKVPSKWHYGFIYSASKVHHFNRMMFFIMLSHEYRPHALWWPLNFVRLQLIKHDLLEINVCQIIRKVPDWKITKLERNPTSPTTLSKAWERQHSFHL